MKMIRPKPTKIKNTKIYPHNVSLINKYIYNNKKEIYYFSLVVVFQVFFIKE